MAQEIKLLHLGAWPKVQAYSLDLMSDIEL